MMVLVDNSEANKELLGYDPKTWIQAAYFVIRELVQ